MYAIIAHRYPNNEVRVRLAPARRAKDPFSDESTSKGQSEGGSCHNSGDSLETVDGPAIAPSQLLDISFDLKTLPSPNTRSGHGGTPKKTAFGLKARRTILRCGAVIDQSGKTQETLMLTGTLPGSTPEAMQEICNWSSYAVDRLKSWISKQAKSTFSMYAWELQKRGALHLHYVVQITDKDARDRIRNKFKKQWYRILDNITEKSGVDMFARESGGSWRLLPEMLQAHAVECKKSVAGYISKYISKHGNEYDGVFYPARWWGCSRPLLARLEELTEEIVIDSLNRGRAESIYQDIKYDLQPLASASYEYRDRVGDGQNLVNYIYPNYVEEAWKNVISRQPIMIRKMTEQREAPITYAVSIMQLLKTDSNAYSLIRRNLSGTSRDVVMKSWLSQPLTAMELATTIAELQSLLSLSLQAGRVFSPQILRWMEVYNQSRLRSQVKQNPSSPRPDEGCEYPGEDSVVPIETTHPYVQLRLL